MITLSKARIATALAGTAMVLAMGAAPAMAGSDIKVRDACDPETFNAALGAGACVRDTSGPTVEFGELLAGDIDKWSFTKKAKIDEGEALVVRFDKGGEAHSLTEVAAFGPGCIPEVNHILGLEGAVPECATFPARMATEYIGPGVERLTVAGLAEGTHRFMCLIHPWMRSTVTVRED
jgi:hypothetical protein